MARKDAPAPVQKSIPSPGYRRITIAAPPSSGTERTQADDATKDSDPKGASYGTDAGPGIRAALPSHLALTANDSVVAIAADRSLRFHHFDAGASDGKDEAPIAEATLPAPIIALATRPGEKRTAVLVALADGALLEVDLDAPSRVAPYTQTSHERPHTRVLSKDLGGELLWLVTTRRYTMAIVRLREDKLPTLIAFDAAPATRSAPSHASARQPHLGRCARPATQRPPACRRLAARRPRGRLECAERRRPVAARADRRRRTRDSDRCGEQRVARSSPARAGRSCRCAPPTTRNEQGAPTRWRTSVAGCA